MTKRQAPDTPPPDTRGFKYEPANPRQKIVMDLWSSTRMFFLTGEGGTGKTDVALGMSLQDLWNKDAAHRVRNVFLTRPTVGLEEYGFLEGTLEEKYAPWLGSFQSVISRTGHTLQSLSKFVTIKPLGFCRGITVENAIWIVDEAQNCTCQQLRMIGSRIGRNAKIIFAGDDDQCDIKFRTKQCPLFRFAEANECDSDVKWIRFLPEDQRRDPLVTRFLKRTREIRDW